MNEILDVMSLKEAAILFVVLLVLATFVPLLFYPVNDWMLYFNGRSLMEIFNSNMLHYFLFEFWGFFIYIIFFKVILD